ncbi:amidophosphoribosyltransferase [Cerasicoccus arenae]|uniref:Amidophosphoribosyltransferase n=1 Tax=Cerasicoccus arenae TaxID=424488 RepID=A0A8J3DEC2_9BACT|nr:amidophosphoribosyltransferase [Cerasicoccus arenae]MBK1856900.1 amidophosphoribosyltransferase [Cerasicoccus arenae]GHB89741.1 amidophosphoribosyltransferase [Cerasicoccus arenae]
MSDQIKHECGIAIVRLLKPLRYYRDKYDDLLYGFQKLFLLMEKQHNRGQDGAGIGCVKLNTPPGESFMERERDNGRNPIANVVKKVMKDYQKKLNTQIFPEFPETYKKHFPFGGEVLMGHLRYGTSGGYDKSVCQPYFRRSPWPTRNLMLAGNFNMTNVEDLNAKLIARGAHPIFNTDTQTVLEEIGYHLDEEHQRLYHELRDGGTPSDQIAAIISERMDLVSILKQAAEDWDGGYTLAGLIGNGDCFVTRDALGIRPAYYFANDEVVAFASERVALMTIFDQHEGDVKEIAPGSAVVVKGSGELIVGQVREPAPQRASCSFERIYFSRGNDPVIYKERKALGGALSDQIIDAIDDDFAHSVFSFIPNTAETAYYGLMDELRVRRRQQVKNAILDAQAKGPLSDALIDELIMGNWPRGEKIAHKDIKIRTFISQESNRVTLASHVYDITYGQIESGVDNLVCIDDSIVRGTTLKRSILRILARTEPKQIIIASTAPQIRYPDCYGIDMSELGKFIAFQATIELLNETGAADLIREVYRDCLAQAELPAAEMVNHVKRLYEHFETECISNKVAELVTPKNGDWNGEVKVIFQSIENLHQSCPENTGDWYFTGNYPTPGGYAVLNRAFINFYEDREGRSY